MILMATVGVQVGEFCVGGPEVAAVPGDENDNQCQQERQQFNAFDPDDMNHNDAIQTKMFKRRRKPTAVLNGDPQRGLPPKCCDRCKSDLNGKLMVRCASCSFRCHLYCFSPPLKQHPAFLIRRQQQIDPNDSSPVWKCEKCEGTSIVFNVKPKPSASPKKKTRQEISPQKLKGDSQASTLPPTTTSILQVASSTGEKDATEPGWIQPVQLQWIENSKVVFDWYRFRREKAEVLRSHEADTNQNRDGVDQLVFYSKSYALMKKTAAIWRAHVLRRRRFRHLQELETKAIQYPGVKINVNRVRNDTDGIVAHGKVFDEEEEGNENLVVFNHYTPYYRRRPRLPLLWKGDPPSALLCWTTGDRMEIADVLMELVERVCFASEDVDAPPTQQEDLVDIPAESVADAVNSALQLKDDSHIDVKIHAAAIIIQRIFARHHLWRRRTNRAKRQRRALEEAQRRAKACSSVALLRTSIQFIVILMRMLGQSRTKKAMLSVIRDAAEDTRAKNDIGLNNEDGNGNEVAKRLDLERTRQLAGVTICRFFVRRVHPYVTLKKIVIARRVQRWWKHKHYPHKWREAAIAARLAHRNQACTRIQRLYRYFRVRSRFIALIEKHALKKVRRVLDGWIVSRLAKKEAERSAVYEAAQQSASEEYVLPENAQLDEILERRGMELYQQGDFWNAASILERLYEMKKGNLTKNVQQTLAYCHHMTWYTSYDQINLTRAHELYCSVLESSASGERASRVDPLVLQDLSVVMMHMEHFGDSLRLLAKLIEYFARQPQFPMWLLLAAVQLQQRGEWEQSIGYLTYLHDIPPSPYFERDILALVAMSYEQLAYAAAKFSEARSSNAALAKEAWSAAVRQWKLEIFTDERPGSASFARGGGNGRALKWELLTNLARRALEQGHYLLSCRVYIYAFEREGPANDDEGKQRAWCNLADAFRHLGHIDLYLNAIMRSQPQTVADRELMQKVAHKQACSFQAELKTMTVLEKLRQINMEGVL